MQSLETVRHPADRTKELHRPSFTWLGQTMSSCTVQYFGPIGPISEKAQKAIDALMTPPPFPTVCMPHGQAQRFYDAYLRVERAVENEFLYGGDPECQLTS